MNNTNKIKKNDFVRILLTETIPTDIPIIFSNDGFYRNCKKEESTTNPDFTKKIFDYFIKNDNKYGTIPLQYKIIKNETSLRTLSLIHPSSQFKFIDFYKKFGSLICYYCGDSKTSLRAPKKIASTYYFSNKSENRKKFKINPVDTIKDEKHLKHASSYFIYAPFNYLYKFYDSNNFLNLEKKYPSMYSVDISNCFDSIYTHTISWALKTKNFSKKHKKYNSFGNEFDTIIMSINDNETNGIVVGPEFSRIFAEIILQDIDLKVIFSLREKFKIEFDVDYVIKRYIDDILIFSRDQDTSNKIIKEYTDQLYLYKLYLNEKKTKNYVRPFYTKKSIIVILTRNKINELNNNIFYYAESHLCLKLIKFPDFFSRKFINEIKLICSTNNEDYSQISSYLISAFFNKTLAIMETNFSNNINEEVEEKYKNFFIFILKVVYFFYSISPTIKSSYKISKIIILIPKFLKEKFPVSAPTIKQLIVELSIDLFKSDSHLKYMDRDKFVLLEKLNIIIAVGELGCDYLLPEKFIEKIFLLDNKNISYFEIMSCLFYIKNHNDYNNILLKIKNIIIGKITDFSDIQQNSEKVYLFLDTLSCPYLDSDFKINLINKINGDMKRSPKSLKNEIIDYYINNPWFIHWRSVDLLKILEKKLYSVY